MGKVVPLHTQQCPLPSLEVSYPTSCPPPKPPPPSSPPRHIYQNVLPPVPPRVPLHPPLSTAPSPTTSPHILLMRKDAALQMELANLHMAIAEKQMEQSWLLLRGSLRKAVGTTGSSPGRSLPTCCRTR